MENPAYDVELVISLLAFFPPLPTRTWFFLKEKGVQSKEESMQLCACCRRRIPYVPEQVTTIEVSGNQFLPLRRTSP